MDTNVVIRYLVQDDAAQGRAAARIIEAASAEQQPLFLSLPVLCEVTWVLKAIYKLNRGGIADTIAVLLDSGAFLVERGKWVEESLAFYRSGRAGFADYLIGTIAREHGCHSVYTFDRALRGSPGFRLL